MLLESFSKRKQDYKMKKLKFFENVYEKKLKYDSKIKLNKSESKKIIKNIEEIDFKNEQIFKHYSKVEKELIEYIAELNVKNYRNEGTLTPELKLINEYNLKMLDILKKKRIKILEEKRSELEQIVDNYQIKEEKRRDNIIYDRIQRDYLVFRKLNEAKTEIEKLVPKFKYLEKEIEKVTNTNNELKRKYDYLKVENKCLLSLLKRLHNKNSKFLNNNSIILDNNSNKSKTLKNKMNDSNYINNDNYNINDSKICSYSSRLKDNNSLKTIKFSLSNSTIIPSDSNRIYVKRANNNIKDKLINNNIFISQKKSIYSNIINKKRDKNRCVSAKIITKNNNKSIDVDKNKFIIKLLKMLIYNIEQKYYEKHILYTKEMELKNKVRNLLNLCVEDLNILYKEEKYEILKAEKEKMKNKKSEINIFENINKIEQKLFIFSYIYDNCLKNGEIKELKRQYSMFQQKNNI